MLPASPTTSSMAEAMSQQHATATACWFQESETQQPTTNNHQQPPTTTNNQELPTNHPQPTSNRQQATTNHPQYLNIVNNSRAVASHMKSTQALIVEAKQPYEVVEGSQVSNGLGMGHGWTKCCLVGEVDGCKMLQNIANVC